MATSDAGDEKPDDEKPDAGDKPAPPPPPPPPPPPARPPPKPAAPAWAKRPEGRSPTVGIYSEGVLTRTISLNDVKMLVLGRCAPADVILDEPSVSRFHAVLVNSATATFVMDLDSAQGTFVADERTAPIPQLGVRAEAKRAVQLSENATVRLGSSRIAFSVSGITPPDLEKWAVPAWCTLPTKYIDLHGGAPTGSVGADAHRKDLSNVRGIVLGRSERYVDLAVPHETVSRQHCAIVHDEETTYVVDLGSAHGTFVDTRRIAEGVHTQLNDGAKLVLGSSPFAYELRVGARKPSQEPEGNKRHKGPMSRA